jgi:D-beta-D-heptose 7-phosphate kinase/D-beta-D-heptose 1-phosphate adenosyltransferase
LSFPEAAKLANEAAGVVVGKLGTQPVTRVELKAAMRMNQASSNGVNSAKVAPLDAARIQVKAWRTSGEKIVFTNGCFDLLHPGHIHLVHQASALGNRLVIGLNADSSVKRLKGSNRPILPEEDRAVLLAALSCVDLVVIFEEDTPLALLEALRPDILVKGADYRLKEVVGRELVESYGGKVHLVPLLEGLSTTRLMNKIASEG